MVGATSSSNGSVGYVNAVPPKDGYNTKYLRADGTWQVPPDHTYTVNNATLTIQKNGTTVKTFTANANSDVTCNITVPTKTSELTNNSGFLTSHQSLSGYVPRNGGTVLNGRTFSRTVDNDFLAINGSSTDVNGAFLRLHGKDYSDTPYAGTIYIRAQDGTNASNLLLKPDGTANWAGKNLAMKEDVIPRSGGAVLTGLSLSKINDNEFIELNGGSGWHHGAGISLRGKDCSAYGDAGCFLIQASNGTNDKVFVGSPNGTLKWGLKNVAMAEDVVPRSGGSVMTGTVTRISKTTDNTELSVDGGTGWGMGATITLYGKDNTGRILLAVNNGESVHKMFLYPNGTWSWSGTACQITSDQRLKQQITQIDTALLDAWEDVELVQFKYNDAVNEKGDNARLHTGYVVQQIDEACKSHNLDISAYGLYCHEEYPEETEEVEVTQEDGTTTKETKVIREASEHYSLRYTETLVVECAYLRRENARLKERLQRHDDYFSNIEKRLQSLENS